MHQRRKYLRNVSHVPLAWYGPGNEKRNKQTKIYEVKERIRKLLSEGVFQNPSNNPSKTMRVSFEAIVFYEDGSSMKIVEWDNGWHYSLWTSHEPNTQYTYHPK